jgi:hypothetical protein
VTWHLAIIVVISCVGMLLNDLFCTILTVAETRGRENLAAWSDVQCDFWGRYVLAAWSGSTLTHGHGLIGWLCIVPVLATGFYTTKFATRWMRRLKPQPVDEGEVPEGG